MKKLLALDLGITTGYAVFKMDGSEDPVEYGEILEHDLGDRLRQIMLGHLISYSVCEDPVIVRGGLGDRLAALLAVVNIVCTRQVKHIGPAQWKQTPFSRTPCPRGTSTHVKDAIRLGRWYRHSLNRS